MTDLIAAHLTAVRSHVERGDLDDAYAATAPLLCTAQGGGLPVIEAALDVALIVRGMREGVDRAAELPAAEARLLQVSS